MVCTLTPDQLNKLFQKVVKDLLVASEKGKPFNMKDYALALYNRVNEKTGNQALAQTYAALVPSKVALARAVNKEIKKFVPNIQEIEQLETDFEDFDKVGEYLGISAAPVIITDTSGTAQNEAEIAYNEENPVSPIVTTFSARPNNLHTTTGNEKDPDMVFSYEFIRHLTNTGEVASEKTGYYLTMMKAEDAIRPEDVSRPELRSGAAHVITDAEGNIIYFDDNYNQTTADKGRPVFFNVRENETTLQSVAERAKTLGITEKQATEKFIAQKAQTAAQKNYVMNGQGRQIVQEIYQASNGFIDEKFKGAVPLKQYLPGLGPVSISVIAPVGGVQQKTVIDRGPYKQPITFRTSPVQDQGEFFEDAIDILMGGEKVVDQDGEPNDSLNDWREEFRKVFFGNNYRIKIKDGILTIDNAPVTNREQLREALASYTNKKGVAVRNYLNIYQLYAQGVPFYTKKGDKIMLSKSGMNAQQYVNFILERSFTEFQPNENGEFKDVNPYFAYSVSQLEFEKLKAQTEVATPEVETATGAEPTTKPSTGKSKFTPKTFTAPKTKSIDEIRNTLNKLTTQRVAGENITEEQINKARTWYENHPLKQFVPFETMFNAINTENPKSVANWTEAGITLFKGSNFTDLYHEAFHAFSQMFLSAKERQKVYNDVRKQKGSFTDYEGKSVKFEDADDLQVEEYLAEEFRKYMLSDGKKGAANLPSAKSWFQKLLDILRALFNVNVEDTLLNYEGSAALNELFNNLRVGNINPVPYGYENRQFDKLDKIVALDPANQTIADAIPYGQAMLIVDSIDSLWSEISDEIDTLQTSGAKSASQLVATAERRAVLYNKVLERFTEKYNELAGEIEKLDEQSDEYARVYRNLQTLEVAIMNFSPSSVTNPEKGVTADDIIAAEKDGRGIIAYHMLKSKYLSFEDRFEVLEDAEEKSKLGKGEYNKNSGNEVSARELASDDVLYILRSLFKFEGSQPVKNELGFNQLQDFDVSWNKLQKVLEGITDTDQMYLAIQKAAKSDAGMEQLLNKLGKPNNFEPGEKIVLSQVNLWTGIYNVFSMKRVSLVQLTVDVNTETGEIKINTGKAQAETDQIKRKWDNLFSDPSTENTYVQKYNPGASAIGNSKRGGAFLRTAKVIKDFATTYKTDPIRFLNALGMNVSDAPEIRSLLVSSKGSLSGFTSYLYKRLVYANSENIYIHKPSELIDMRLDDGTLTGLYKTLLALEAKYSDKYGTSMVSNAKGDAQFELTLRSTVSNMIDYLNKAQSYQELIAIPEMAHLNVERNPFVKDLYIMKAMFGDKFWETGRGVKQKAETVTTGTKQVKIELQNSSGVALTENGEFHTLGIASNEADETTQILQNFYMMLQYGVAEGTRHSDKSTTYLYRVLFGGDRKHYVPIADFADYKKRDGELAVEARKTTAATNTVNQFMNYLASEVARIYKLENGDVAGKATVGDTTYKDAGSKFVIFEDILKEDTIKEITDKYISADFLEAISNNPSLRTKIREDILDYLDKQTAKFKTDLSNTGALDNEKLMTAVRKLVPNSSLNQEFTDDAIIRAFVVNDWIHKYETTSIFYGDIALYNHLKEEFHKRNSSVGATGGFPRTDTSMLSLLQQHFSPRYSETGSFKTSGFEMNDRAKNKKWGKTFASAILEDTKVKSVYMDEYVSIAKKAEADRLGRALTSAEEKQIEKAFSEYNEMKIGDAQGWITFDSYRALLVSLGKWTQYQEDMYNAIIDGKEVSAADVAQFFPIKKMQYSGPLKSDGLPLMGFHKFSLMPLIPTVIKGTHLEVLHNKMVSQGIDYATFQSGSKVNSITKNGKVDEFYSDPTLKTSREVSFAEEGYDFTPNDIFLEYFKDQLEIADKFKGSVIFSTQLRKLVEEGLMENGKPVNFKGTKEEWDALDESEKVKNDLYSKLINYEKLVRQLTDFKVKELIKEADITFDPSTGQFKLTEKLIDFVKKELTRQDLAEHEIDFIKYDRTGNLVYDLSIHPSAEKIEKLLTSLIYKRIVRQKVNGEALIQVSGAGFEPSGLRGATAEEIERYGTNGLASYRYDEKGTKAMQVKIALQGDFKKLLKHPEVIVIAKARGISNFDALNIAIKDEKWLAENKQMITIAGVRIPVQGLNSMEFMQVAEFLPENSGNMVILPAEIVAKSGSDFDIDKLSLMFPSLLKTSKGVSMIKHDSTLANKVDADVLRQQISDLYQQLGAAQEDVLNYTKDYLKDMPEELKLDFQDTIRAYKQEIMKIKNDIYDQLERGEIYPEALYDQMYDLQEEMDSLFAEAAKPMKDYKESMLNPIKEKIDDLKIQIASASSKGIENDLLGSVIDIISLPSNFVDFITPNGTFLVKPLADRLADKVRDYDPYSTSSNKGKSYTYTKKDQEVKRISGTRVFELGYNRYKQSSNNIGKKTLGLGAVDNSYNTVFNRIGAYMSAQVELGKKKKPRVNDVLAAGGMDGEKYTITKITKDESIQYQTERGATGVWSKEQFKKYTKDNTLIYVSESRYTIQQVIRGMKYNKMKVGGEEVISLSNLYDANNQNRIASVISQMMNGWVDVAKDSWIFDIQGNPEISSTLLFMVQAGVPVDQAVMFVSQPIIRDYVKLQRKIKGVFARPMNIPSAGTNMFRVEARRQLLSQVLPSDFERYTTNKKGQTIDRLGDKMLKRTLYTSLVPTYLEIETPDFSIETLENNIEGENYGYTNVDRDVFLHFMELEEMAKATTAVKLGMNFDTTKLSSLYEIREKLSKAAALEGETRLPDNIVDQIENNSPIGSFKTQKVLLDMVANLFPLRDHSVLVDNINKLLEEISSTDSKKSYKKSFSTNEQLVAAYKNDFTNYILQQYLKHPGRFNPRAPYRGLVTETEVVPVKKLKFGAFVEDGKLFVDIDQLNKDFDNQAYAGPDYLTSRKLANVRADYFTNANPQVAKNDFFKFVYEREVLRSTIPFDEYKNTVDFAYRIDRLELQSDSIGDIGIERLAYEEFLRDSALFNTLNIEFMFKDPNGFAAQAVNVGVMHPELAVKYPLLKSLFATQRGGVVNLKLSELQLDTDKLNLYHENLEELSDPNVKKVDNPLDNAVISKLFTVFPMFAFFQAGQDGRGQYSLARIVNTKKYAKIMDAATDWALNQVLESEYADKFMFDYNLLFDAMYAERLESNNNIDDTGIDESSTASKPKRKLYSDNYYVSAPKGFVRSTEYDPAVKVFTKPNTIKKFEKEIQDNAKAGTVFVYETSTKDYSPTNQSFAGNSYNNTYLKDMVKNKKLDRSNVSGIATKPESFMVVPETFLTDNTYASNIETIEKGIQNLIKLKDEGKIIVFDSDGYGAVLLGYGASQKFTKEDKKIATAPAPETFVYLSKRLYEEFGYVNPGYEKVAKTTDSGKTLAEQIVENQPVTDDSVREKFKECFKSLLEK